MWSSERLCIALTSLLVANGANAAIDLSTLVVVPERGQSADQARRDRYECHNWAVDETGVLPGAGDLPGDARGDRIDKVLRGASIGAVLGGLIRASQRENASNGVLAGAAVGAAVGAATGRKRSEELSEADDAYLRALSACLEGRGYRVALPGDGDGSAAATDA